MNTMTWLDLYKFLHEQANNSKNFGKFDWGNPVTIHDAETGNEYACDTYLVSGENDEEVFRLVINSEAIFR